MQNKAFKIGKAAQVIKINRYGVMNPDYKNIRIVGIQYLGQACCQTMKGCPGLKNFL